MILVTGATGKTGGSLIAQLRQKGLSYRAASRHATVPFDWEHPGSWDAVLEGVASIYLVAPGTVKDPYGLMQDFITLAMGKGVCRFVFLSMAGLAAGGPAHGQVHQWLKENTNDWAVLCPSAFMQNFSAGPSLATIRDEDRIYSNTAGGRVPFIDVGDIAAAALAVLTAPAPLNTEFVLTGDEPLSYDEVAALISQACGRPITHVHVSRDEMAERLIKRGIAQATAKLLAAGYQMIAAGTAEHTTNGVRTLAGRPPMRFQDFAKANAGAWQRAE
nr:NmrA family NAD(P)-binding protein [Pseudomonas typographi]